MPLIRTRHPEDPTAEMAFSEALLREVAAGTRPVAARVFRPGPAVAFSRRDALEPGYARAVAAAAAQGYPGVVRLGGGRAAAYDEGSVIVEVIEPQDGVFGDVEGHFAALAGVVTAALQAVGITPEVGELAGEYCPGRWSVHAAGSRVKLAGLALRSIKGATLTTGVVLVEGGARLRGVLRDVYAELGLTWDPVTAGAAEDVRPGLQVTTVEDALVAALTQRWPLPA